jgi:hypothetical protein
VDALTLIVFFLVLIGSGFIAEKIFSYISLSKDSVITGIIFALLIFIINIIGLYFFKNILTLSDLEVHLECLSFLRNYALLSIGVGILLAIPLGYLARLLSIIFFWRRR